MVLTQTPSGMGTRKFAAASTDFHASQKISCRWNLPDRSLVLVMVMRCKPGCTASLEDNIMIGEVARYVVQINVGSGGGDETRCPPLTPPPQLVAIAPQPHRTPTPRIVPALPSPDTIVTLAHEFRVPILVHNMFIRTTTYR